MGPPGAGARAAGDPRRRRLRPRPPSGADSTPANGRIPPYEGQVIPGSRAWSTTATARSGRCRTTASAPRPTPGTSCCASISSRRSGRARRRRRRDQPREYISLRDPRHAHPVPDRQRTTSDRLLTGADFDIESVVRLDDGTFWIGEEFGPFLLHVDATGDLLAPPVRFPDGKSPSNPTLSQVSRRVFLESRVRGDGAVADGRSLLPIVEGAFVDDPVAAAASCTSSICRPSSTRGAPGSTRPTPPPT